MRRRSHFVCRRRRGLATCICRWLTWRDRWRSTGILGHVHLNVSDLGEAEAFYHSLLGLDVTHRCYRGALFFSAGGYHHHVAVNVWAGVGAPPAPVDAVGLISFALRLQDRVSWELLQARVQKAGGRTIDRHDYATSISATVADPAGNGVELLVERV
jgi:catechol 2,3-dioxygenase